MYSRRQLLSASFDFDIELVFCERPQLICNRRATNQDICRRMEQHQYGCDARPSALVLVLG